MSVPILYKRSPYLRSAAVKSLWDGKSSTYQSGTATLSGNEFYDDPDEIGIWEATTNLITNGGVETNTTGWVSGGTNTAVRSSEQAKYGSNSLKVTIVDSPTIFAFAVTVTAAVHTASCWVYVPSGYNANAGTLTFTDNSFVGGASGSALVNLSLRDQWQRVSFQFTPIGTDLSGNVRLVNSTQPTGTIYVDGLQVEARGIATPYVETNGGTATRSPSRVRLTTSGILNPTQSWVAQRWRLPWASNAVPNAATRFFWWDDDAVGTDRISGSPNGSGLTLTNNASASTVNCISSVSWAAGDVITVIFAWDASNLKISFNGGAFASASRSNGAPPTPHTQVDIGSQFGSSVIDGALLWMATGTGTLTDADAAYINSSWATNPSGFIPR